MFETSLPPFFDKIWVLCLEIMKDRVVKTGEQITFLLQEVFKGGWIPHINIYYVGVTTSIGWVTQNILEGLHNWTILLIPLQWWLRGPTSPRVEPHTCTSSPWWGYFLGQLSLSWLRLWLSLGIWEHVWFKHMRAGHSPLTQHLASFPLCHSRGNRRPSKPPVSVRWPQRPWRAIIFKGHLSWICG